MTNVTPLRPHLEEEPPKPEIELVDGGVVIPVGATYEQWAASIGGLQNAHKSFSWWVGRLSCYGEDHFPETWTDALSDYSAETIQSAMRVCRAIAEHRVRPTLGFSYHSAVLGKLHPNGPYLLTEAEQDALLARAEREGWSRAAMRQEMAEIRRRALGAAPRGPAEPPEPAQAQFDTDHPVTGTSDAETEPAEPAPPITPDEAAEFLRRYIASYGDSWRPKQAFETLLAERETLLAVASEAKRAVRFGLASQDLADAVDAAWPGWRDQN